jgi:hypothetical protein
MKKSLIILLFLTSFFPLFSQTNGKLWGGLELGFGIGLADKGNMYDISFGDDNKMTTGTIRGVLGYYVMPQLSIGAGIGLSSYTKPGINTIPVCFDMRFHPMKDNMNLVLNGDFGYALSTNENDLKGKFITDISVGYKLFNIKKISFTPFIGYNYSNYKVDNAFGKSTQSRHSVFFKIAAIY